MRQCKKCSGAIPSRVIVDGALKNLQRRTFCLQCSPFNSHNTRDITVAQTDQRNRYYKWQKKERKRRKQELVKLLGGKCLICGYNKCYRAMEFDHVRGNKAFTISNNLLTKWEKLVDEAMKCDLHCANCHRERHDDV